MSIKFLQMRLPQGRKKAFTISYDDGVRQDQRLLDLMKKYGIRGTFNLNSGLLGRKEMAVIDGFETDISTFEADEIREMYQGQEIACHALTHMSLAGTPTAPHKLADHRRQEKSGVFDGRTCTGLCISLRNV